MAARGLDFYDRLVDELLAARIEPFVTFYHWDLPQALEDEGGWPARATAEAFVEYAEVVASRLGDRVRHWITHNEPWVCAWIGHAWGQHAPGRTSEADAVAAAHHLLLSHGWAAEAIRRSAPGAQVGITLNLAHAYPASKAPEDEAAAWRVDGEGNRWFLDPVFRGSYPADLLERNEIVAPFDHVRRIGAAEDGIEEPPIRPSVDVPRGSLVFGRSGGGIDVKQVQRDADLRVRDQAANRRGCPAMRQE